MYTRNVSLEEFDQHIDQLKKQAGLKDVLHRLQTNPDFVQVINEEYLRNEAVRLVELKCDPEMASPESQKNLDDSIMGISALRQFFQRIHIMGSQSERDLDSAYDERQRFIEGEQE